MKKISYYVAAFALCCGVSQTLTSCVDETAEPEYVKEIRESEMAKELAENSKDAKVAGKESEAAFTEAFLDGTLSANTTACSDYNQAKSDLEDAETVFKSLEAMIADPEWIQIKAYKIAELESSVVSAKETKKAAQKALDDNTSDNAVVIAGLKKALAEAVADVQYAEDLLNQYKEDAFSPIMHQSAPTTWQELYEGYLYAQAELAKAQANYDEKKAIYDKAIEAMQKANKE